MIEDLEKASSDGDSTVLSQENLLMLYHLTLKYIDYEIRFYSKEIRLKDQENKEIEILLLGIYKNHQLTCKKLTCSCKRNQIGQKIKSSKNSQAKFNKEYIYRGEPKDVFDEKCATLVKSSNIKLVIGYLEQQFSNYVEHHGMINDNIDFCYMKFLIMYSGKITTTYHLLNQKINQLNEKEGSVNTKTNTPIE